MKIAQAAKAIKAIGEATFETFGSDLAGPMIDEAKRELGLGSLLSSRDGISSRPKEIGQEELKWARAQEKLEEDVIQEKTDSDVAVEHITRMLNEYQSHQSSNGESREQKALKEEFIELREEVAKLTEASGVKTTAHMETSPQKIGLLDIKRLKLIIKDLTAKVEDSKNGKDMVAQRENAKRTTGMLAWVSGKQMKVHEQGTLQLQG